MPRIALIHALAHSVPPINEAMAAAWPEAGRMNLLDDSLSADLARRGRLDDAMTARFLALADYAVGAGAQAILFTCSAFGPCIDAVKQRHAAMPVLKPNEAMIDEAVAMLYSAGGLAGAARAAGATHAAHATEATPAMDATVATDAGDAADASDTTAACGPAGRGHPGAAAGFRRPPAIGLVASFGPTLASMPAEFPAGVPLRTRLAEGALAALDRGDAAGHDAAVLRAARALVDEGCTVLALAQFSLARARPALEQALAVPVLTTPESAIRCLRLRLRLG